MITRNLLFVTGSLLSFAFPLLAMEGQVIKGIKYNLFYAIEKPRACNWELTARNDHDKHVGMVKYNCDKDAWRITKFEVEPYFRNSGHGYGTALLKKCFQEITKTSCTKITWTAYPLDDAISQEQLKTIYRKIIEKINLEIPGQLYMRDTVLGTDMTYIPAK